MTIRLISLFSFRKQFKYAKHMHGVDYGVVWDLTHMGTGGQMQIPIVPTHKLTNKAPCWFVSVLVHEWVLRC